MKLSIIIPTLVSRRQFRKKLVSELRRQVCEFDLHGLVELLIYEDAPPNQMTTGEKRQACLEQATGEYICCIDDDDRVSQNYLQKVFEAMESNPDCITFCGEMTIDNKQSNDFVISLQVQKWELKQGVYYRYPHHLCPIKKEIAKLGAFPRTTYGEDIAFANSVKHLLKTEAHIKDKIYFYDWISNKINGEQVQLNSSVRRNTRQDRADVIKRNREIQSEKRRAEAQRRQEAERIKREQQKRNRR